MFNAKEKQKETMQEFYARLYPADERTCADCGRQNKSGENFNMKRGMSVDHYCPECEKATKVRQKAEQDALYASGEETPDCVDNITCPWCGYEDTDSWESAEEDDKSECPDCGGIFAYTRSVSVTYTSERVSPPEPDDEESEETL